MKGACVVLLNCVCILSALYSQGIDLPLDLYEDPDTGTFVQLVSETQIAMWKLNRDLSGEKYDPRRLNYESGGYIITENNGVHFLTVSWNNQRTERFVVLTARQSGGPDLLLYNGNAAPFFYGVRGASSAANRAYGNSGWIRASSTLTEGKTVYSTDKLGLTIGECWVEGAAGQGINERLSLKGNGTLARALDQKIYISSGFVNFQKPSLYQENSRIKRIRVSDAFGNAKTVELRDTPHFQSIDLSGLYSNGGEAYSVFIDILDVYPGTKHADTCVNAIYYFWK